MANQANPLVLWGGGAVIVAAAVILFSTANNNDPPKGTCELGSAGVALVVTGLTHGESARAISSALSGVGANVACNAAVESLTKDPTQPVNVRIGGTPQSLNAHQFQQTIAVANRQHALACLTSYGFANQNDIDCLNYKINP
jgi:hypothetical protein